jgi:hypothetical protein
LSLHSSEAPQGIDLSRPLFTSTNANQAATCTCNTRPRVSTHHVVNHSSQLGATIHRSSDAPVLSGPHSTPLATGSLKPSLLISPLLGGPARHGPFALALHLHQRKSSCNLHLQYSHKSQSTPRCQSHIIARSDQPPVLGHSGPQIRTTRAALLTPGGRIGEKILTGFSLHPTARPTSLKIGAHTSSM